MGGSCCSCLTDGSLPLPPESKLASGDDDHATGKKQEPAAEPRQRTLNRVGRRHQLAFELIQQVSWLRRAVVPRIAWVVRDVADAGWTAEEVMAWLDLMPEPTRTWRPSGLLASRLKPAAGALGWTTPGQRARAVQEWRESRRAERARHDAAAGWTTEDWRAPSSRAVQREVATALAGLLPQQASPVKALPALAGPQDLSDEELAGMREAAWDEFMAGETALVMSAVEAWGRPVAEGMYGADLVQRALRLVGGSSLMALGRRRLP